MRSYCCRGATWLVHSAEAPWAEPAAVRAELLFEEEFQAHEGAHEEETAEGQEEEAAEASLGDVARGAAQGRAMDS